MHSLISSSCIIVRLSYFLFTTTSPFTKNPSSVQSSAWGVRDSPGQLTSLNLFFKFKREPLILTATAGQLIFDGYTVRDCLAWCSFSCDKDIELDVVFVKDFWWKRGWARTAETWSEILCTKEKKQRVVVVNVTTFLLLSLMSYKLAYSNRRWNDNLAWCLACVFQKLKWTEMEHIFCFLVCRLHIIVWLVAELITWFGFSSFVVENLN